MEYTNSLSLDRKKLYPNKFNQFNNEQDVRNGNIDEYDNYIRSMVFRGFSKEFANRHYNNVNPYL